VNPVTFELYETGDTVQPTTEQIHSYLFLTLIQNFQIAAMRQMGKLKNPLSDKIERDMKQAKMSIDMLEMFQAKTRGNLSVEEDQMINHVLKELQLIYIQELKKEKPMSRQNEKRASDGKDLTNEKN